MCSKLEASFFHIFTRNNNGSIMHYLASLVGDLDLF